MAGTLKMLLALWGVLGSACAHPAGTETLINSNVDFILNFMRTGMVIQKFFEYSLGSFSGDGYSTEEMALFNVSTIRRTGDCYMQEPRLDDMTITASLGFSVLELRVGKLTHGGQTYPAKLVSTGWNSGNVRYTMYNKSKRNCRTQWELLQVEPLEKVTLSAPSMPEIDGRDITQFVNNKVLPDINHFFTTKQFLDKMSHDFNFCFPLPGM
uniref:Venom protein family 5 protein 1 n=1 Tax=Lethocerus distinctifemur TaxID=280095 RepID=A0A2K8JLS9_9HEMI|nr:venom protein family 5 protein 1 [Lethocerus distinctifemur]